MSTFTGFPVAALDFYDDLELDNTKSFWSAHKHVYDEAVRGPMVELTTALADEFGQAKVFRPYRDVRFRADKTPYKTHQGAFVGMAPRTGWYVEISAAGTRVGGGFYAADAPQLAALRRAMADERTGEELATLLAGLASDGWEIDGESLKTAPRGWPVDHPRIDLLRRKQLFAGRRYGFEEDAIGPGLLERVRSDWRALRPVVEWLADAGGSAVAAAGRPQGLR